MMASGDHVRAIGWLHPDHPFATAGIRADFLTKLKELTALSNASEDALGLGVIHGQPDAGEQARAIRSAARWAPEKGGANQAMSDAALRFLGNNCYEICEQIRKAMIE